MANGAEWSRDATIGRVVVDPSLGSLLPAAPVRERGAAPACPKQLPAWSRHADAFAATPGRARAGLGARAGRRHAGPCRQDSTPGQDGTPPANQLQIAVEGEYPPFNTTDKKGRLVGFDVDIANALCKSINASCVLVKQRWDRMIPDLVAGKYDLVVSSMSITAERRQKIDFTDPYYQSPAKFVAKKGTDLTISPAGLKGQRIGVQRATIHEQYLNSYW